MPILFLIKILKLSEEFLKKNIKGLEKTNLWGNKVFAFSCKKKHFCEFCGFSVDRTRF